MSERTGTTQEYGLWLSKLGSVAKKEAVVVGLYGLPGSGKTTLLNKLKTELGEAHFAFYDGSQMIAEITPQGLDAFKAMKDDEKLVWRQRAINEIGKRCANSEKCGIVAGHYMFWDKGESDGKRVCTKNDLRTYTHILYLDVPAELIEKRQQHDRARQRPHISVDHLDKWQIQEKRELRRICRKYEILFSVMPDSTTLVPRVKTLLQDFRCHNENHNESQAIKQLKGIIDPHQDKLEIVMLIDADKTLAPQDTGGLFWDIISKSEPPIFGADTMKRLFEDMPYSYLAFRQAMLLYEEAANQHQFDSLCTKLASMVTMYPEFLCLLQSVALQKHVSAVVVTSGLRCVWEKVIEMEGLSEKVRVIGGGRLADGFVVSPTVKGALTLHLQQSTHLKVWAFGDSPLDLDMLKNADRAVVVVGDVHGRSKSMELALEEAIDKDHLNAVQTLLPHSKDIRVTLEKLPQIKITSSTFTKDLFSDRHTPTGLRFVPAENQSAVKLLSTPMRDAAISGVLLREAHRRVGSYLATEILVGIIGLEPSPIRHVLGHQEKGFRLFHEEQTVIVALMRGGEPMAYGVNDAFPLAMLVHAKRPYELEPGHLEGMVTVILVDSVVNTGASVLEFVDRVRELHATIRIVIVAGVIQDQCVTGPDGGSLGRALAKSSRIHLVALRLSTTKFKGSRKTDTGNRLFNSTHLE